MIKCNECNTENPDGSKFCINCGARLTVETGRRRRRQAPERRRQTPQHRTSTDLTGYAEGKTPIVACGLSLLIVGLGQFYNGDMKKGGMLLVGAIVVGAITGGIVWLGLAIYAAYDAYQVADGQKQLEEW